MTEKIDYPVGYMINYRDTDGVVKVAEHVGGGLYFIYFIDSAQGEEMINIYKTMAN